MLKIIKIKLNQTAILHQIFVDYHILPDINLNEHRKMNKTILNSKIKKIKNKAYREYSYLQGHITGKKFF